MQERRQDCARRESALRQPSVRRGTPQDARSPLRRDSDPIERLSPTIADLYRSRWEIEIFFKWIKQHLRIKAFYGTSENAVKTQIWIAVSVYVLVAIVKKRLNLRYDLYTLLQILSLSLFEKTELERALSHPNAGSEEELSRNQLQLFNF